MNGKFDRAIINSKSVRAFRNTKVRPSDQTGDERIMKFNFPNIFYSYIYF